MSIDPKYAVILAAGSGTRLRPLTNNTPKCLVKVYNQPILYYQIKSLLANNIKKILIVIGYKGDMIRNFISSEFDNKEWIQAEGMQWQCMTTNAVKGCFETDIQLWLIIATT